MSAKYIRLAGELERRCRALRQSGQTKLPGENALCRDYGCSRQTVRAALALLEEKGLILRRRGSGTYLAGTESPRSREIVLLAEDGGEYLYPALIRELRRRFEEAGCRLVCRDSGGRYGAEAEILRQLLAEEPAGLLLEPICDRLPSPNEELIRQLAERGLPMISLFCPLPGAPDTPCVRTADREGAYRLTELLAARGCRRLAGIFRADDSRGPERFRGCLEACRDLRLPFEQSRFLWISAEDRRAILRSDDGRLRRFLDEGLREADAVICQNDEIAYRLLCLLEREGGRPGLTTASFDGSYYVHSAPGELLSMRCSVRSVAEEAAEQMLRLLAGKRARPAELPWELP